MNTMMTKLNKLITLKAEVITSLLDSLETAETKCKVAYMANKVLIAKNEMLETELQDAKDWWRPLDKHMGRIEAEERSDEIDIDVQVLIHRERTLDELRINKLNDNVDKNNPEWDKAIPDNVTAADEEVDAEADDTPF